MNQNNPGDDSLQKRLIYQSWHRGVREADLILGPFSAIYVPEFSPLHLEQYEAILGVPDSDFLAWVYQQKSIPEEFDTHVMSMIMSFVNPEEEPDTQTLLY